MKFFLHVADPANPGEFITREQDPHAFKPGVFLRFVRKPGNQMNVRLSKDATPTWCRITQSDVDEVAKRLMCIWCPAVALIERAHGRALNTPPSSIDMKKYS